MQADRVASCNRFAKTLDPLCSAITKGRTAFVRPGVVFWDETQNAWTFANQIMC